jgi:hypothetical protein
MRAINLVRYLDSRLGAVLLVGILALPLPVAAQRAVPRSGSDQPAAGGRASDGDKGGGRAAPRRTPSSEGTRSSGGEKASGGNTGSGDTKTSAGGSTSSGGDQSSAGRPSRGQASGRAVRRSPASGDGKDTQSGNSRTAARRDRSGSGNSEAAAATPGTPAEAPPPYSRSRGNNPATGTAVARRNRPPVNGDGGTVWVPGGYYGGYYPWGYGGFGLGGYYGGFYDPWYYGGYYDPWYYGGAQPYYPSDDYEGRLRLKVKPRSAEVFVDGYFAGVVDEYDGVFQRLRLEPGPHRIEIREVGYEPLEFDVRISPDDTTTYTGELRRIPSS